MTSHSLGERSMASSKKAIAAIFVVALMIVSVGVIAIPNSIADSNPSSTFVIDNNTTDEMVKQSFSPNASWDKSTSTLSLNGVKFDTSTGSALVIKSDITEITIKVTGSNSITSGRSTASTFAIDAQGSIVNIIGTDRNTSSLTLVSGDDSGGGETPASSIGLGVDGLKISDVNLSVTSGKSIYGISDVASDGISCLYNGLVIENSDVTVTAGECPVWSTGIEIQQGNLSISNNSKVTATSASSGEAYGLYIQAAAGTGKVEISDSDVEFNGAKSAAYEDIPDTDITSKEILVGDGTTMTTWTGPGDIPASTNEVVKIVGIEPVVTQHTVTYKSNGGTGTVPGPDTVDDGSSYTVKSADLSKSGYEFVGWTIEGDTSGKIYEAGDKIQSVTSDITFVASWEKIPEPVPPAPAENNDMPIICLCLVAVVILAILALAWCGRNN